VTYFDTPDLLTYRQHLQGRRRRYKVRTRAYLDSGACMFEVKLKGRREQTIKARLPYPVADRTHINSQAQAFLADQLRAAYGQHAPQLAAKVTTAYRRTTLVDLQRGTRLTCDVDLTCGGGGKVAVGLSRHVLVETKLPGRHGDADIALRSLGLRPVEMSKYCVGRGPAAPGNPPQPLASHAAALLRRCHHERAGPRTQPRFAGTPSWSGCRDLNRAQLCRRVPPRTIIFRCK